jgi:hypothetical protein
MSCRIFVYVPRQDIDFGFPTLHVVDFFVFTKSYICNYFIPKDESGKLNILDHNIYDTIPKPQ